MRVNNLTPQDLKAYGINDVRISFTIPATTPFIRKNLISVWKAMSVAC